MSDLVSVTKKTIKLETPETNCINWMWFKALFWVYSLLAFFLLPALAILISG